MCPAYTTSQRLQELLLDHEVWALGIDVEDLSLPRVCQQMCKIIAQLRLPRVAPWKEIDEQEALLRETPAMALVFLLLGQRSCMWQVTYAKGCARVGEERWMESSENCRAA